MSDLNNNHSWFVGPQWLKEPQVNEGQLLVMPTECASELKATVSLLTTSKENISHIISISKYSSLNKLLRVTMYVLKFIRMLRKSADINEIQLRTQAETLWIQDCQSMIIADQKFDIWKKQLCLYLDSNGIWRCGGRLSNADIMYSAKYPIILSREHPLSVLIVRHAHERVFHNGVRETLAEVRSNYWIPQGRSFVRKLLFKCTICRRYGALHYSVPPPPPLPRFRVQQEPPFTFAGVDFAGPLYVKGSPPSNREQKVWICLFTCCVVRAVHLEIVINLSVLSFIRCLKRFMARRGLPRRIVSDNAKTFKGADKFIRQVTSHHDVMEYLSGNGIKWQFNAPWWGGMFERMIGSTKKCLRKMIGQSKLSFDELNTAVTEVELILNSHPISYISPDDLEEPLTPSHLMVGRRLLTLPDNLCYEEDETYSPQLTSDVVTRRMNHLNSLLERFWKRWSTEYLQGLRESHSQVIQGRQSPIQIKVGNIVVIHKDKTPRGFWSLGRVEEIVPGQDGLVRSAVVRVYTGGKGSKLVRRLVQRLYPVELSSGDKPTEEDTSTSSIESSCCQVDDVSCVHTPSRPKRGAALEARDRMVAQSLIGKD